MCGPQGSGKTMLLHAICTELNATLIDLTATNIVGRYPGKSGLNMLLHLVIKVGRLMQPTVIYIDQAEKTFLKKVSKTDKSDPKRLKKDLPRLVRSLASEDRMILIGASRCPWECEQKVWYLNWFKLLFDIEFVKNLHIFTRIVVGFTHITNIFIVGTDTYVPKNAGIYWTRLLSTVLFVERVNHKERRTNFQVFIYKNTFIIYTNISMHLCPNATSLGTV